MKISLRRQAIRDEWFDGAVSANAGLLLRRGLKDYDEGRTSGDKAKGGSAKQKLIERLAGIAPSGGYELAFERWRNATTDPARFTRFSASLIGRLYIGLSRESALETGITVQHAWGMPMIPGSALKGVARAVARERLADKPDLVNWLFGADNHSEAAPETGALVFHDAWWVPEGKPFAGEIVTPHHVEYYKGGGAPATDFDSPVPSPQIAAQGAFYFVIEGDENWRRVAEQLLRIALEERGVGGKRSSGYGFFSVERCS